MEAVNKIPVFDIVSCELYVNPKRRYSVEKYFKMVVSIPDEVESPMYGWFVKQFTDSALSTSSDSSSCNQVRSSGISVQQFMAWRNHSQ
jgi:hypothetical protein